MNQLQVKRASCNRLSPSLFVALAAAVALFICGPARADLDAALSDYAEFRQQAAGMSEEDADSTRQSLIEQLESLLDQTPKPLNHYSGNRALAELYEQAGRLTDAVDRLNVIAVSEDAFPDMRATAAYDAITLASRADLDADVVYEHTVQFVDLMASIGESLHSPELHERRLFTIELNRSQAMEAAGRTFYATSKLPQENRQMLLLASLRLSAAHMHRYVNHLDQHADDPPYPDIAATRNMAVQKLALLHSEIYSIADELEEDDIATFSQDLAISAFEYLRHQAPELLLSNDAGRSLLALQQSKLDDLDEWVDYTASLLQDMPPGHGVLNYLSVEGAAVSRDPETREPATAILSLVVQYHQEWFPEQYTNQANYQYAILQLCQNLISLGQILNAIEVYAEILTLDLHGGYAQNFSNHLVASLIEYMESGQATRIETYRIREVLGIEQ